jgi:hypothetical protein
MELRGEENGKGAREKTLELSGGEGRKEQRETMLGTDQHKQGQLWVSPGSVHVLSRHPN